MHTIWHAVAAYYQNHFDNKILLLKRKKKKGKTSASVYAGLIYCDILKRSVLIY